MTGATHATGAPKEASIAAMIVRRDAPEASDRREFWQIHCPHCGLMVWLHALGIISYWHRNPLKRFAHWWKKRNGD